MGADSIKLYECGICGGIHPWGWDGDCRDDANRYADEEDYLRRNNLKWSTDTVLLSWADRCEADDPIQESELEPESEMGRRLR